MSSDSRNIYHDDRKSNKKAVADYFDKLAKVCDSAELRTFTYAHHDYSNVVGEIEGQTKQLIVIGAHLDSTAANNEPPLKPYDPEKDPAPGADDNGSGVAGVIAIAKIIRALADQLKPNKPERTIRFVLFNAEEYNMQGSLDYALDLKKLEEKPGNPSLVAMIALDMIGWHRKGDPPYKFEIHGVGTAKGEFAIAKAGTDKLVAVVKKAAKSSAYLKAQEYPQKNKKKDPATNRSDHSSFQGQGWAACLVTEDAFADVCKGKSKPGKQTGNPNYHRGSDEIGTLDPAYIEAIAKVVAEAAWTLANPNPTP
jgi:bacterial leucyl aminopeptidase